MKVLIIALLLFISFGGAFGQSGFPYRIPAGVKIESVVPFDQYYLFPSFRRCAISYVDGKSSLAMVNYNLLYQKMVLITVRKDTTFLKNDYMVKQYNFDELTILNDQQYGLIELRADSVYPQLGKRDFLHLIPVDEGTFDGYSNFVDPSNTSIVLRRIGNDTDRVMEDQFARSNILAEKKVAFFFIDRNHRVFPASGKYLYRMLPRHRNTLRTFVKEESVDFKDETSLKKLINFCQSL